MYFITYVQYSVSLVYYNQSMPNFYPFLIYVFVTTFTPGPNNIMAMTNAVQDGYKKTVRFILGVLAGMFVILAISGFLNLILTDLLPSARKWINILGALYMVFLAIYIIRSKPIEEGQSVHSLNTFKAGFFMQFINIKVIVYGITVFSLFMMDILHDPLSVGIAALVLGMVGFAAASTWAIAGNVFRIFLKKYHLLFNLVMGGLLIYTAIASIM